MWTLDTLFSIYGVSMLKLSREYVRRPVVTRKKVWVLLPD